MEKKGGLKGTAGSFCVKCKKKTQSIDPQLSVTSTGRPIEYSTCTVCGTKKSRLMKVSPQNVSGSGVFNDLLNKLPLKNVHLPGYNYAGPFTELDKRLNPDGTPKPGFEPKNEIDRVAMEHDKCYAKYSDTGNRNNICDKKMLQELDAYQPKGFREKLDKTIVKGAIGAKYKLGFGRKSSGTRSKLKK